MNIRSVALTRSNLPLCERLWADRSTYTAGEFRLLMASAAQLLDARRALGAIVFEGDVARAFGLSTYVAERFLENYLVSPHPQIGRRLLQDPESTAIFHRDDIARRNRECGSELVVLNTAYDPGAADPGGVVGELMAAFQRVHRGYRIARITNEVFGDAAIQVVTSSASYQIRQVFEVPHTNGRLRSMLATLTRAQAVSWNTPLLSMFLYNPPAIVFTNAQRDLLEAALSGLTDSQLGHRLGVKLTTIKARWTRIYDRAFRRAPHLFAAVPGRDGSPARGAQLRHLILQYVRDNPEELTPYLPLD